MIRQNDAFDGLGDDWVKVRVHGASGTVLLDRAQCRNAISRRMLAHMHQALNDLHQEKKVRAVIFTGRGDAFCAGTDLAEIRPHIDDPDAQVKWHADCLAQKDLIELMLRFPKPIISAVNGPALGFGAAIVLASDVVVAGPKGTFGFPETLRGLVPGLAAPLLAFRIGAAAAADFLLRGQVATAQECQGLGLYRCLVDDELVWAKADEIARELAHNCPTAVSMTKRLINETVGEHLFTQLSAGAAATASARTTESAAEGIAAFLDKRAPQWP